MYEILAGAEEIRRAEQKTMELYEIGQELLIENAAIALKEECPKVSSACIFCGKGNNGADGYALARQLFIKGVKTEIIAVGKAENKNAEIAKKLNIKITQYSENIKPTAELYVDAIFGTGLSRSIEGESKSAIEYINGQTGFKLSVDLPSGINADTGEILGCAVRADKTVTMQWAKPGLYQYPGKDYAGEICVRDISIPSNALSDTKKFLVKKISLPERKSDSNKGSYGKVLTVCGSRGMAGAAYMSTMAAVKSGCGLVSAAVPECIFSQVAGRLSEAMTIPLPCEGAVFSSYAADEIAKYSKVNDTLLIGCGIRNTEQSAYLVREAIKSFAGKNIVVDADGLNVLSEEPEFLNGTVITPHPGEMARLVQKDIAFVQRDRIGCAKNFAQSYGCIVILKGAGTVIAYPDGRCYINTTGNPGMANGGSGDVLAGLTASLLAQKIPDAAIAAAYVHGLAGDIAAERHSVNAMSATDIIKMLPLAIKKLMYDRR